MKHLNEIFEFRVPEPQKLNEAVAATQIRLDLEHLNEIFEFRVPEPEQLNEAEAATQIRLDLKHLNEIFEFRVPAPEQLNEADAATQIRLDLKHLNEIFEFRVPEPEQLDERFKSRGVARRNLDQVQLDDGLTTREYLRTVQGCNLLISKMYRIYIWLVFDENNHHNNSLWRRTNSLIP